MYSQITSETYTSQISQAIAGAGGITLTNKPNADITKNIDLYLTSGQRRVIPEDTKARTLMRYIITALCLLAPLTFSPEIQAAPKKKKAEAAVTPAVPQTPIDGDLGKLKWGMTVEEVKNTFHEKIDATYKEKLKGVRDVTQADALGAQKKKEKDAFDASYKKFDVQADIGKLSVSIISNEIKVGSNESMLIIKDEKSQRYLFFSDNKLYKLFVAYDGTYLGDVKFPDFILKITDKHGAPVKKFDHKIKGESQMVACNWGDTTANLWVEDKRDVYGSVVLVYDAPTGRQIDRSKQIEPPKTKSKFGVDDSMIDNLGVSKAVVPAVVDPKTTTTDPKTTPKKEDPKKKKNFDPLESLGL
jgi:hypothetical protein